MNRPFYALARGACRFVGAMYVRHRVVHAKRLCRPGPYVLACTHHGHLEPALVGSMLERRVHWLAREEFFRRRIGAVPLRMLGAIELDRFGVPVRAMRSALRRLGEGEVVGIFPEGGRSHGGGRAVHGGPIKGGAALLALRAGVPIVPVVVVGIEAFHRVGNWMPGQRTTIRTIVGPPLVPPPLARRAERRHQRRALTADLARAFVDLHGQLLATDGRP